MRSFKNRKIYLCCASMPSREESLKDWVVWALEQPVDYVCVYLDRWPKKPSWIPENVQTIEGDLKTLGRFSWVNRQDLFVITDDDIIYPPDYVMRMLIFLEEKPNSIVCVHGSNIKLPFISYYERSSREVFGFRSKQKKRKVDIPGVGTSAFDAKNVNLSLENFSRKVGMDSEVAFLAKKQDSEIWIIDREENWLKVNEKAKKSGSIFHSSNVKDGSELDVSKLQTKTVFEFLKL